MVIKHWKIPVINKSMKKSVRDKWVRVTRVPKKVPRRLIEKRPVCRVLRRTFHTTEELSRLISHFILFFFTSSYFTRLQEAAKINTLPLASYEPPATESRWTASGRGFGEKNRRVKDAMEEMPLNLTRFQFRVKARRFSCLRIDKQPPHHRSFTQTSFQILINLNLDTELGSLRSLCWEERYHGYSFHVSRWKEPGGTVGLKM